MRFFITGKLQSKIGPRQILTTTLFMLLIFIAIHGIKETLGLGLRPQSIAQELHRLTDFGYRSPLILLEDMHIYLLLFTMIALFLGALIYNLPLLARQKIFYLVALHILILLYPISKFLTFYYANFAIFTLISGALVHIGIGFIIIAMIIFLFSKTDLVKKQ